MIPEQFPIERIEDYHTHHVGVFANGDQFFGSVARSFKRPENYKGDWGNHVKEHLLLYIFDPKGNHINTHFGYSGVHSKVDYREQQKQMEEIILKVNPFQYCDIIVKPFSIKMDFDGIEVDLGLIPNYEWNVVEMYPGNTISFRDPWDGSYDT